MEGNTRMCIHYWLIDSHNKGQCRLCEEIKQFPTTRDALGWSKENTRKDVTLGRIVLPAGEYYMQGHLEIELLRRL